MIDNATMTMLDEPVDQTAGEAVDPPKPDVAPSRIAIVREWLKRIEDAEKHWESPFKRMRRNMEFAAALQWEGEDVENPDRYSAAGITSRTVQQKVSALYARDPKAVARPRERRDFALWDGKLESIAAAFQKVEL